MTTCRRYVSAGEHVPDGLLVVQVDNLVLHEVLNTAQGERVHLVADVAEHPVPERLRLQPGQVCEYASTLEQAQQSPGC
jgi:hypothetical protein